MRRQRSIDEALSSEQEGQHDKSARWEVYQQKTFIVAYQVEFEETGPVPGMLPSIRSANAFSQLLPVSTD